MRAAAAAAAASGQPMAVKRDGLLVMLALNTILLVAVLITSWVDVGALKLFTYEWVHRLQSVDARTHTQLAANMTKEAYLQNRDSSPAKLGSMLEDVFQWARWAWFCFFFVLRCSHHAGSPTIHPPPSPPFWVHSPAPLFGFLEEQVRASSVRGGLAVGCFRDLSHMQLPPKCARRVCQGGAPRQHAPERIRIRPSRQQVQRLHHR